MCNGSKQATPKPYVQGDNTYDDRAAKMAETTYGYGGEHAHQCDGCGSIWRHSNDMGGDEAAHTCKCGAEQWMKGLSRYFKR